MRHPKHVGGDAAEAIAALEFIEQGAWVFTSLQNGPADMVVLWPGGAVELLDIKKLGRTKNRNRKSSHRIHRVLTTQQLALGVRLCYVDLITRQVDC
tara:strand:+ start:82 stop:372 length:291 start_codon:yes stop_codon:yes gene_type:complete